MIWIMRRAAVVLVCVFAGTVIARGQEEPKPPKDSLELVVTGCLNKSVLNATKIEPEDVETAVHDFHLSGKKDVMAEVKNRNKQRVIVTGWVRKVDLTEPGMKIGGSRVRIGPATSGDPMRPPSIPEQQRRLVTMEAIKIEAAGDTCAGK